MEANMEANMDQHGTQHGPPWYLSHGDLPHTLKAGNQHGSQQNKTPLSVLHEPSLAARLCMCGFGLQPKPTWNPTDILKKHKLNLVMKEPYHSSPPTSTFLLAEGLAPTKFKKTSKRNPSPLGWDGEAYFGACCATQPQFFLGLVAFGERFPSMLGLNLDWCFFAYRGLQEPEN